MPLQTTSGAASYDGFGGGVAAVPNYIEDFFYTYLRPAQGGSINYSLPSGMDLYNKGGIVWVKSRNAGQSHAVMNPNFKATGGKSLQSNTTAAFDTYGASEFSVNSNNSITMANGNINDGSYTYVDWTFVKQPKFFDVVTWTGDDAANRQISHSLGSVPGCIIVKRTDASATWRVWHQNMVSNSANLYLNQLNLNTTDAVNLTYGEVWGTSNNVTSTTFQVGSLAAVNATGGTYVAYLFAHNAGGFGLTGTDNVISCGSFTAGSTVNLGYEPQWLLVKRTDGTSPWELIDNMRGFYASPSTDTKYLVANTNAAEQSWGGEYYPTATGFTAGYVSGTYIYIAIRRGPMKVPTTGTSVFSPNFANASAGTPLVTNFPVDLSISVATGGDTRYFSDRLRGVNSPGYTANKPWIASDSTGAELTNASIPRGWDNTQILLPPYYAGGPTVWWNFKRAPSFFDEVCWTPNGSANDRITHNLGVPPELIITKTRSPNAGDNWWTYSASLGRSSYLALNTTDAASTLTDVWGTSNPTSTDFGMKDTAFGYDSTYKEVAYLFATCAGVSKVGSYTGNGSTQTINCGFTGGARFVLIKRTDASGYWFVYDTARGMTVLTDPYLFINTTAAESATLGSVTTVSTGFALNSAVLADINISAGTYIFLAIA